MSRRGHRTIFLIVLFAAAPLFAQSNDDRIRQLEVKIDALMQQATALRQELDRLKGTAPAPAPTPAAAEQDLTKIGVVTPAPTAPLGANPTNEQPATAMTDVQTINNILNPGASKVFNPDTSVIANFIGKAGRNNPFEFPGSQREPMQLDEAEIAAAFAFAEASPYPRPEELFEAPLAGVALRPILRQVG